MAYDDDSFKTIEQWLVNSFPGTQASYAVLDREVVLFRVHEPRPGAPRLELEISREAFEDRKVETIVADLVRQRVTDRLRADPTLRLNYTRDRDIPHVETLWVACDERQYRVVRNGEHNVRIYDKADRLLANWPAVMTVMPNSIHRRVATQWCDDIRKWRGLGQ